MARGARVGIDEDFRIWGRIEHAAPAEFVVVVTKVPETGDPAGIQTLTAACVSRDEAKAALRAFMTKMGHSIRTAGGRVTDTEVDGL